MVRRGLDAGLDVVAIPALLLLWEVAARAGWIDPTQFPAPSAIAQTLVSLFTDGFPVGVTADAHVEASVYRILVGFVLASLAAIPLGLFAGSSPFLNRALSPVIGFCRSVAALGLLPLVVAWFGIGQTSRLVLVAYAAFWVVLVNTISAVQGIDPSLRHAAETLGASRWQVFSRVTLMASLPRIFTGLRVALGVAFLVIVAVEMVGTDTGLGSLISQSRTFFRSDIAISSMVLIALVGSVITWLMALLERVLLPWRKGLDG